MFEFCKRTIKSNLPVALRWAVVILVVGLVATFTHIGQAAPVTFAFEATVVKIVDKSSPADLPFTVENGDVLIGQFTFEPVDADPGIGMTSTDTVQEFNFSVVLDSTVVSTTKYVLQVRDNSPTIDAAFFTDQISLSCSSVGINSCQPGTVPDTQNIIWFFGLGLSSDSLPLISSDDSPLVGADISPFPDVWNQFTGHISLTFQNEGVADVLRITAQLGNLTVVPEPLSKSLLLPVCKSQLKTEAPGGRKVRR